MSLAKEDARFRPPHELNGDLAPGCVDPAHLQRYARKMIALADRMIVLHGFRVVAEIANDRRYQTMSPAIMAASTPLIPP